MRDLIVATGDKVNSTIWRNRSVSWERLCTKLSTTITTTETVDEYKSFDKKRKSDCKDYGGFVGGKLKGTHRKASEVEFRSLITLDMDKAKVGFYEKFDSLCEYACFLYTTHGHRPESPRYRLVFPLARDIDPDEFTAISRLLADKFGIDQFDPVSFKIEQIMFWPSTCVDGVFVSRKIDKEPLDPDAFLKDYPDWKNLDTLPRVSKEDNKIAGHGAGRKMSDPREKPGVVGAFNRVYSITHAIDEFLSDVYEEADRGSNRYHFIGSSSIAGALVYDDLYFYSHHASDPAFGKTLDAFSLVKLHKFGDEKDSFTKMKHFALEQDDVRSELARTKYSEAKDDFEGYDEEGEPAVGDTNWRKRLEFDFNGEIANTSSNLILILENDIRFRNIAYNQLADAVQITGDIPWKRTEFNKFWKDSDTAQLQAIIDKYYTSFSERNFKVAFTKVTNDRSFNPVRDYLDALPKWDGVKRVEMFIITHLLADDNDYVKEATRKWFAAAVARIYNPGIKFDNILVLDGKQGVGKSTLFKSIVANEFFSDSLQLSDMDDNKKAGEKIQGFWIIEIQELAGMKKADIEKVKGFISCTDDKYRPSYGRTVEWHPRQCIIFATVNGEQGYLRDLTGNRRFWVIKINSQNVIPNFSFSQDFKDQLWAEAKYYYEHGEKLYLSGKHLETAAEYQNKAMEHDDRVGIVEKYLDELLPDNWEDFDIADRRYYFNKEFDSYHTPTEPFGPAIYQREEVSPMEIWCECFNKERGDLTNKDSNQISMIMAQIPGWEKTTKSKIMGPYGKQRYFTRVAKK